jgi:hypothetical protein
MKKLHLTFLLLTMVWATGADSPAFYVWAFFMLVFLGGVYFTRPRECSHSTQDLRGPQDKIIWRK